MTDNSQNAAPDAIGPSPAQATEHDEKARDAISGGGGGSLDFSDAESGREGGNRSRTGGTTNARGGDSAPLGAPSAGLSNTNGPSDPAVNPAERER